jgi:hypothetical protein
MGKGYKEEERVKESRKLLAGMKGGGEIFIRAFVNAVI